MRSTHSIELELLPNLRIKVGRVNPIKLKLDPIITLDAIAIAIIAIKKIRYR
jgi:hypothetical protein